MKKAEGKRSFRRHRHRWENNITTDIKETGWDNVVWIHLAMTRTIGRVL
jgi:hypothetical protein